MHPFGELGACRVRPDLDSGVLSAPGEAAGRVRSMTEKEALDALVADWEKVFKEDGKI